MTIFVVDTNVPIAANGRRTHADAQCQLACMGKLEAVVANHAIAVDEQGAIVEEYSKHLSHSGTPGVGDMFFKHVFNNQYGCKRVRRVPVTPSEDDGRGFAELPDNAFDPSDRKFLAVAVVAHGTILNATDSDWDEQASLMKKLGVEVCQLCPQHDSKPARRQR